jgi:hypothetical protein
MHERLVYPVRLILADPLSFLVVVVAVLFLWLSAIAASSAAHPDAAHASAVCILRRQKVKNEFRNREQAIVPHLPHLNVPLLLPLLWQGSGILLTNADTQINYRPA